MARRAAFGQAYRPAPSLSSTIVAIAREMDAQEAQNIMDAWQKGGSVDGKKVTDEGVLAYWHKRLKDVSKDDPLYDTYKNTIDQYEYSIGESKVRTANLQGNATDQQVASFYLNWAKKVPKNSEFYRVLQRDAAQFMQRVKANGDRALAIAKEQAYRDGQAATLKKYEANGDYLTGAVTAWLRSKGNISLGSGGDISKGSADDPAVIKRFFDEVNYGNATRLAPDTGAKTPVQTGGVAFTDPVTGKTYTTDSINATLKKNDPNYVPGHLSVDYYAGALTEKGKGVAIRLKRAKTTGHLTDADSISKEGLSNTERKREAGLISFDAAYADIRSEADAIIDDPTSSAADIAAADARKKAGLKDLLDKNPTLDPNTAARVAAEIEGDPAVNSLHEDLYGFGDPNNASTGGGFKQGDIAAYEGKVQRANEEAAKVASGEYVWAQGSRDNNSGEFIVGNGFQTGAIPKAQADQMLASGGGAIIYVTGKNGVDTPTMIAEQGLQARVYNGATGKELASATGADAQVGTYLRYMDASGNVTTEIHYTENKGSDGLGAVTYWTKVDVTGAGMVGPNTEMVRLPDGTMQLQTRVDVPIDGSAHPGLTPTDRVDETGAQVYIADPRYLSLDQSRMAAGPDPGHDFPDPTQAGYAGTVDEAAKVARLQKNPTWAATLQDSIIRNNGGYKADQVTPANPAAVDRAYAQALLQQTDAGIGFAGAAQSVDLWRRGRNTDPTVSDAWKLTIPGSGTADHYSFERDPRTGLEIGLVKGDPPRTVQLPADAVPSGSTFAPLSAALVHGTDVRAILPGGTGPTAPTIQLPGVRTGSPKGPYGYLTTPQTPPGTPSADLKPPDAGPSYAPPTPPTYNKGKS